jgi:glycosyltransferase involved in cell wall biosynthesis
MGHTVDNHLTKPIRLSIAAPCFNECESIFDVVQEWHLFLQRNDSIEQFEIIICNDGSQDQTGQLLDQLAVQYPELHPIHFPTNQGAACALQAAIRATKLDWVLLLDSDNQFPITNVTRMLTKIHNIHSGNACAILGIRDKKDSFFLRMGSKLSGYICNLSHRSQIKDFNSACKLVSGRLLRSLILEANGMNYSTEITSRLLEAGVPLIEVDIEHRPRTIGTSSMKFIKDSLHRMIFVLYISLRQFMLKMKILRRHNIL